MTLSLSLSQVLGVVCLGWAAWYGLPRLRRRIRIWRVRRMRDMHPALRYVIDESDRRGVLADIVNPRRTK